MRTTAALLLCLLALGPEASAKEPAPETRKVDKSKGVDPREAVETKRIATLQQIVQKYRAIVTGEREPEEQNRQAAAYLSRVPGIKASGHGLGGAWAQFDDGPVLILDNSMLPMPDSSPGSRTSPQRKGRTPPARSVLAASLGVPAAPQRIGLPSTRHACLYATSGVQRGWMVEVEKALDKKMYVVDRKDSAGVDDLKRLPKDCGVFVLNAHGTDSAWDVGLQPHYAIQTDTVATPASVIKYWSDLEQRRLVFYHPIIDWNDAWLIAAAAGTVFTLSPSWLALYFSKHPEIIPNLAITDLGVKEWWDFPDNALVYMATCRSGADVAAAVRKAVLDKNASLYVGWTGIFQGGNVGKFNAEYLFDRLLGANVLEDLDVGDGVVIKRKETPPQRAFPWELLTRDMARKERRARGWPDNKYNTDKDHPGGWTEVTFEKGKGDLGLLAPSIQYLTVDEEAEKITLHGWFGADPGEKDRRVTIGDEQEPLSDCEWKQEQIRCHLDASQHGLVVAWSISRPSNPVNLTRWKIRFKFTHSVDLAHVKLGSIQGGSVTDASCIFRADVHEHRLKPGEPPVRREAFEVYPAKNSTAEWTTIGQRFQIGKLSGTGSGSGTVKTIAYVGSEATAKDPAGSFLVCEGRLDPAKGFELSFRIQDKDKVHVPGAKNADFVDMVTGLGRSQDGLDDDAVIAKHLLRGMIVPFDFFKDDSFRIPGFHLQKSTPYTTYDEDRRMEVTAGTDFQGLSCGDSKSSSPGAPCVTPDSPPHEDAAR